MKNLLIAAGIMVSTFAFAGNVSILNYSDAPLSFQLSQDQKNWQTFQVKECKYNDPFFNLSGHCDGIDQFSSNSNGKLYIRFQQNNKVTKGVILKNQTYSFYKKTLNTGYFLNKGWGLSPQRN